MKFVYPAIIRKNDAGKFQAFFPDLDGCSSQGDTLNDALDLASEALYDWLYAELTEENGQLPHISEASDMELLEGDIVRNIAVNVRFTDGWDE